MKITVKLYSTLRIGRFDIKEFDFNEDMTVEAVCRELGISLDKMLITMVNSRHVDLNYQLSNNDILAIFLAVGGG